LIDTAFSLRSINRFDRFAAAASSTATHRPNARAMGYLQPFESHPL
jgi:hypothetical protein